MGYLNKKTIYKVAIVTLLIITTMILRLPGVVQSPRLIYLNNGLIYSLIYFGLFISWGISIKGRIIQKQVLKFLIAIVALMLFWFMVRTIKYRYIEDNYAIERWLWYSYYIPMLLIPLLTIFIALSLGKLEDYRLPKWTRLTYLPTIILIISVLTNDFHQLVFKFPQGQIWTGSDYRYGILYWPVWLWMVLPILVSLIITIAKSQVPHSKKIVYLPFIPYLGGLIYGVLYIMKIPLLRIIAGDMTAIFCLFTMAIYESLIQSGLIRSNIYYEELFYASDLKAKIMNKNHQIFYETSSMPVEINDNMRKSTFPISGGQILWLEDVSEVNRLIKEVEEINQRLSEENNLLQAELELRERKIKIDEKIRLYNKIIKKIEPQLQLLDNILSKEAEDMALLQERLVEVCVVGTYIKRQSNLLILREDKGIFSAKELEYCLRESVEAISQGKITASLKASCKGSIKAGNAVLIYDLYEEIIETILPSLEALFINLNISKGLVKLKLQIDGHREEQILGKLKKKELKSIEQLTKKGGYIKIEEEDGSLAIAIELPKAGEGVC